MAMAHSLWLMPTVSTEPEVYLCHPILASPHATPWRKKGWQIGGRKGGGQLIRSCTSHSNLI